MGLLGGYGSMKLNNYSYNEVKCNKMRVMKYNIKLLHSSILQYKIDTCCFKTLHNYPVMWKRTKQTCCYMSNQETIYIIFYRFAYSRQVLDFL